MDFVIQEKQHLWSGTKQPGLAGGGRSLSQESKPGVAYKEKEKSKDKYKDNDKDKDSKDWTS